MDKITTGISDHSSTSEQSTADSVVISKNIYMYIYIHTAQGLLLFHGDGTKPLPKPMLTYN